jgi:methylated-DNA-[protein]-cysteine S-methyltransferase
LSAVPVWSESLTDSTLGVLRVWATETGVRRVGFYYGGGEASPGETLSDGPPPRHLQDALTELRDYLAGRLRTFDLPLDLSHVTPFQLSVYQRLLQIPYGHIATYGEIARDIGAEPNTARAVGSAVGANPIAIVVPCHRVVAADGRLTGFMGGLPRKAALLRLEGIDVDGARPSSRVHPEILRLPL